MRQQPQNWFLILSLGLAVSLYPHLGFAATGVLQTSSQWQQTDGALVQKPIDVNKERVPSESAPNEIVVKFKSGVSQSTINAFHAQIGVTVLKVNASAGFMRVRIPSQSTINQILNAYGQNPNVRYAEPVYYFKAKFVPDDTKYAYQWNLYNPYTMGINMQKAWDVTFGSRDVIVAIVDTGVAYESYYDQTNYYYKSRDFFGSNFVGGYDFVNNDTHPNDDHWHGTFVAGIIAHTTNNNLGGAGVAPQTSIMPIKVMDSEGRGSTFLISEGIIWAADHNADIINLSLGGPEPSFVIEDACAYAYQKGVTLVCAAGNRGLDSLVYPAAYNDYCIAVGATRLDGTRAYYSDYGKGLDLVAPGGDVQVDQNRDNIGDGIMAMTFGPKGYNDWVYLFAHGTSMATAHVSGVAALVISRGIASSPDGVRAVLQATALDKGAAGYDYEYGWGQVDAYAAVTYQADSSGSSSSQEADDDASSGTGESDDADVPGDQDAASSDSSDVQISEGTDSDTSGSTDMDASESGGTSPMLTDAEMEVASFVASRKSLASRHEMPSQYRLCGCRYYEHWLKPDSAYGVAKRVFVGKLVFHHIDKHPISKPNSELSWSWYQHKYVFEVIKNYKGVTRSTVTLYHKRKECIDVPDPDAEWPLPYGSRGTCQYYEDMCGHPSLLRDETYLIYSGDRFSIPSVDMCMRILPIDKAQYDLQFLNSLE